LAWIDLLRGWAALVMIEVHVFNAFLLPSLRETTWFSILNFVNGLVAPSFLFVSGFVFVLASERKLNEFRSFGRAFWKQIARIGFIWLVGYALHLPFFSFSRIVRGASERDWLKFYQVDILHCIALGLFVLFLLRLMVRSEGRFIYTVAGGGVATVLLAPYVWEIDFIGTLPAPLAAYVNGQHFSQFPIFNWVGFMMFGGVAAAAYQAEKRKDREPTWGKNAVVLGVILIVLGTIFTELPVRIPYASTAVRANPLFFATRLGIVLLFAVACWWYVHRRQTERSFAFDVGRESLLVYALHLLIIYGDYSKGRSLASLYGKSFGVLASSISTFGLMAAMVIVAKGWGRLKSISQKTARLILYAIGVVTVVIFFVRES